MITDGMQVSIEYTLTLTDGTVADTNVNEEPLVYTHGQRQLLQSLESALAGLSVGDERTVAISAAEGYGEVDPEAFQVVPAAQVPENARQVGAILVAGEPGGQQRQVRVHEVDGENVVIDLNHPLAGEDLSFDVKVLAVEAA